MGNQISTVCSIHMHVCTCQLGDTLVIRKSPHDCLYTCNTTTGCMRSLIFDGAHKADSLCSEDLCNAPPKTEFDDGNDFSV